MPKDTFFKLSDEKRQRILKAGREEFCRVSYSDASINKIIKNADISRGSFYQYFEDKQDLFLFILHEKYDCIIQSVQKHLIASQGNIFRFLDSYIEILRSHVDRFQSDILREQLTDQELIHIINGMIHGEEVFQFLEQSITDNLIRYIDYDIFIMKDPKEIRQLLHILGAVVREGMLEIVHKKTRDRAFESIDELQSRIRLLEHYYTRITER